MEPATIHRFPTLATVTRGPNIVRCDLRLRSSRAAGYAAPGIFAVPKSPRHAKRSPAQAAPGTAGRHASIDNVLYTFMQDLARAGGGDTMGAALTALGASVGMPHLELTATCPVRGMARVYSSPDVPQRILQALHTTPLSTWALEAMAPVSLTEMKERLAVQGLTCPRELAPVEALMFSLPVGPELRIHANFFGIKESLDGLTRSLLFLAMNLAHERALTQAWPGTSNMTPRELEVLDLAMSGRTDAEVAKTLGLSTRTVRYHLANARRKTLASSRAKLVAMTARR